MTEAPRPGAAPAGDARPEDAGTDGGARPADASSERRPAGGSGRPRTFAEGARNFAPDFLQEMFANPLDAGYFDAAERRRRKGPPSAGSRRFGFGLRTVALVLTGLLLAIAYQQTVAAKPEQNKVTSGLAGDVRARQQSTDALEAQADTLRAEVTRLRNASLTSTDAQQLTNLEAVTGLGPVRGDGAVIVMSDGPVPTNPVTGQPQGANLGQVLDVDLQAVTNELWRDGAEAITIDGQRLTSTTTIRAAGSAILVDFVPVKQPYQIQAIGPGNLAQTFRDSPTGAQYERFTQSYGMHFQVRSRDNLSLPAVPDVQLRYAGVPGASPPPSPARSPRSANPSPSGGH